MAMAGLPHPSTLHSPDDLDGDFDGSDLVIGRLASLKAHPQYLKSTGRQQVGPSGAIDRDAWQAPWFRLSESPEEVEAQLEGLRDGNFAVRRDLLNASDVTLFYVYGGEVCSEQLLSLSSGGVRLEHGSLVFRDLSHLVEHHTEQRGELPVQLIIKAAPFIPEEGLAPEGDPFRVNDVCNWLEDIGLGLYKDDFRRLSVDGAGLAALTDEQLRMRFSMSPQHQAVFFQEREKLDRIRVPLSARHTETRKKSYIVKDVNGRMRAFDADTGEEITNPGPGFLNYVRTYDAKLADQLQYGNRDPEPAPIREMVSRSAPVAAASVVAPAVTVAKGEFEWHGPAHGWVRHVNGRRVAQDEFGVRDVQAWLETFGHDKVQEGFKAQQVDGPTFADLTDGDLRRLGNLYQVPQEFVSAGQDFRQNAAGAPHPSVDVFVDIFAERAPWYKTSLPYDEALADLTEDDAPSNAFVVCQDPSRTGQFRIEMLVDPATQRIVTLPIEVVPGRGLRLQGRPFVGGTLSELVQYYGAYNGEPDSNWILNTEASEETMFKMPWYSSTLPTVEDLNALRTQPEGSFLVHPVLDGTEDYAVQIVHGGNITTLPVVATENGFHVDSRPEALFYNVQHLVDYFSFVHDNHLGLTLYRDADAEQAAENVPTMAAPPKWYMPHVDRATAETVLRNAPNGTFLVRSSAAPDARFCLSYVFNGEVYHMLVDEDHQGASFREAAEAFNSVDDLIEHHQQLSQTALFCPLAGVASVPGSTRDLRGVPLDTVVEPLTRALPTMPMAEPVVVSAQPKAEEAAFGVLGDGNDYWLMLDPVSKAEALASLQGRPEGAFVIRSSERFYECTVLSYIHGNQILHELIGVDVNDADEPIGIHLVKEGNIIFPDFRALVDYHKMNQTVLQTLLVEPTDAATRAVARMPTTSPRSAGLNATTFLRETAPWLITGMPEQDALSLLKGKPEGAFIIRQSPDSADLLILSYVAEGYIYQNYVEMSEDGVHLQANPNARFLTLHDLVAHYSTKQEELKTALRVHDGRMAVSQSNSREMMQVTTTSRGRQQTQADEHLTLSSQHARSLEVLKNQNALDYREQMFYVGQSDGQLETLEAVQSSRTLRGADSGTTSSRAIGSRAVGQGHHHHHERHEHHERHGRREQQERSTRRSNNTGTRTRSSREDVEVRRRPTAVLTVPFQRSSTIQSAPRTRRASRDQRQRSRDVDFRRERSSRDVDVRRRPHAVMTVPFGQGMDTTLRRRQRRPKEEEIATTTVDESDDGKTRTVTTTTVTAAKPPKPEKPKKEKTEKPKKEKVTKEKAKKGSKTEVKPLPVHEEPTPLESSTDVPVRRGSRQSEPAARRETDPLPVLPTGSGGVQEGNVDDASPPSAEATSRDVHATRRLWKKMGYSKEEVARDIAQEDGAFIVHSPAEGVGERVLAALTFRSRGNLVTRDILSDDQSVYLQGSAQRFDGLPELVTYYVASPQTDLNVPNLLLPSQ